ncbi:MAG: transporter [Hymenobacter sp.]|jgi:cobalt-zinc-cadmium efflux system membrane fusion protein|nr:transporter [Hymenobacter sp.]
MNRTYLALLAAVALAGCSKPEAKEEEKKGFRLSDTMMQQIVLDTVRERPVQDELVLTGEIQSDGDKTVKVYPLVGGVVERLNVQLGDKVTKGQLLAVIKSGEIADVQNQTTAATSDLDIAKKNLAVAEDMYKAGLNSERDVVLARAEVTKARGTVGKNIKQLSVYGIGKNGVYELRAPISGFITEKNATEHEQFNNDNVQNLFTVSNLDDVWIMANVFESDISKVKVGYAADVTTLSYPDKHFRGKIDKVFNVLDPDSKVMKVRVRLQNPGYLLKPEMYAQVRVENTEAAKALALPAKSVVFDKDRNFVMVYRDRTHVETRPVTLSKTVGDYSYVTTGVKRGDVVIAKEQLLVYDELND